MPLGHQLAKSCPTNPPHTGYDAFDRLTSALVVKPQFATTYDTINYEYDRLSRLKRVHDGSGIREELTTYRDDGDVDRVTDALGSFTVK